MLSGEYLQRFVLLGIAILCVVSQVSGRCGSALLREYNTFPRPRTCQPFHKDHDVCSRVGNYRTTTLPNFLNHGSQSEAHSQLANFQQLIATQCSSDLLFFLCLYHFPLCVERRVNPVVPCKGLCERVRDNCSTALASFNRTWPEQLNCDALPADPGVHCDGMDPEVCVSGTAPRDATHQEEIENLLQTSGAAEESKGIGNNPRPGTSTSEHPRDVAPELEKCHCK